jgi:hypothetical protein
VVRGNPLVSGGPQAVSEGKALQKFVSNTSQMKTQTYISVLKLPLLVDLQQKVGQLVISITSCPSIIMLEKTLD